MTLKRVGWRCLALVCSLVVVAGCGDDAGSEKRDDEKADASTLEPKADASAGGGDAATLGADASGGGNDGGASPTGAPACDALGVELRGTVDGRAVDERRQSTAVLLPMMFRTLERTGEDEVTSNLRLVWDAPLSVGTVATLKDGILAFPSMPTGGIFCVLGGTIGLSAKQPASGARYQFTITGVKSSDGATCSGGELAADLRGCLHVVAAQ